MQFLADYGLFLLKTLTLLVGITLAFILIMVAIIKAKKAGKEEEGLLSITKLNEQYDETQKLLQEAILSKKDLKKAKKALSKKEDAKKRLFVIDFIGDIRASAVHHLREEITAILLIATPEDEVLLRLESPGGMVNAYGLAASQLDRLKEAKIKLIIAVDKMAASGGYMMACVADKIIAAPFAIIGSIGVVFQLPNFHRFLQQKSIDFEQVTAGEYKRTLTMLGKNTSEDRAKVQMEVNDIHSLFKNFICEHRPQVNIEKVATGEHWFALQAFERRLIDQLTTSDDYLLAAKEKFDIFLLHYKIKKTLAKRITVGFNNVLNKFIQPSSGGRDFL
jgi:serine protease SohB